MNDHESMLDNRSRWGSCAADLDEMPPEDFEYEFSDSEDFSIKNFLLMAVIFICVIFVMFRVL